MFYTEWSEIEESELSEFSKYQQKSPQCFCAVPHYTANQKWFSAQTTFKVDQQVHFWNACYSCCAEAQSDFSTVDSVWWTLVL